MKLKHLSITLTSLLLAFSSTCIVFALNETTWDRFDQHGIYYYNPDNVILHCNSSISTVSGTGYDRLKEAVRLYGEVAMDMQREYGTPWEVVIAQMQMESQVGTAGIAISGADNNWLGIIGSGDAGSWISSTGRAWARFSSVEESIRHWAGPKVLRNGYYDDAFAYLDPASYNLETFLRVMISHYAPASDGNDESAYTSSILSFINGPIREARSEMGWPSSAELASNENIPIGGSHPLGTTPAGNDNSNKTKMYNVCAGNGDINKTAILLSWPDRTHDKTDPKPEYFTALNQPNGVATLGQGDQCSIAGHSCDAFVATVMRYSGADPDFPCCGAANQLSYLSMNSQGSGAKYIEIPNIGDSSNLQPGDIRSKPEHIEMYIVLENGSSKIASASHCNRTGDHGVDYYPDSEYRIFRRSL